MNNFLYSFFFLNIIRERERDICGYNLSLSLCMGVMRIRLVLVGRWVNEVVSFVVFCLLDIFDYLFCFFYKIVDYFFEVEWKFCYCLLFKKFIIIS